MHLIVNALLLGGCLTAIFVFVFCCYRYRWKRSPYSKFPNEFWLNWEMIYYALRGGKYKNLPLTSFYLQSMINLCKRHESEGLCLIRNLFSKPTLFIYGEAVTKFFVNEPSVTHKPRLYKFLEFMLGNSILTSNGKEWKNQRKIMKPAFYSTTLEGILPVMNSNATSLVQKLFKLNGKATYEMWDLLKVTSLKIFFESTCGVEVNSEKSEYRIQRSMELYSKIFKFVVTRLTNPWLHYEFMMGFSSYLTKHIQLNDELQSILKEVLDEMKEKICSSSEYDETIDNDAAFFGQKHKSLGELLIKHHLEDPSFTMEDLRFQLVSLTFAGYDTASNSLAWTLWLLGLHQNIQKRAYEEILGLTSDDNLQYDEINKLVYLQCIIKESLRLYPTIPVFARYVKKDLQFEKYRVPKGTAVAFFPYLLHRNPAIYKDPKVFSPDRFADSDSKLNPWTHIPFAEGGRPCLGKNFAMMEMKVILFHILKNFNVISLGKEEDVILDWELTLKSAKPMKMLFVPRSQQVLTDKD